MSYFDHYVEGVIYQTLTDNKRRKEEKNLNKKERKEKGVKIQICHR
jgi:hypothetical protein